jgi:hypothetical protein
MPDPKSECRGTSLALSNPNGKGRARGDGSGLMRSVELNCNAVWENSRTRNIQEISPCQSFQHYLT